MGKSNDDKTMAELDEAFNLLTSTPKEQAEYEKHQAEQLNWKMTDPEGYKKDMEQMCRDMFGDKWEVEYQALLREEFPEEFHEQ